MVPLPSAALDTAGLRKARGAFFTPEPVARYITDWAVRSLSDRVLEPSCGEASFLLAAVDRLAVLRGPDQVDLQVATLDGVELHEASADAARELLHKAGVRPRIEVGDFFCVEPTGSYDVVIGNPPFVRYQEFSGEARARSRAAALRAGVPLTNLASSWAAFAVHSALFLRRGGRMGLVLPAELLSVNYAAEVRGFLLREFASVDLVMFSERVFPEVQEEVVLLLADGYRQGPTDHASIYQARNATELASIAAGRTWKPARPEDKWTASLLSVEALSAYTDLISHDGFSVLESWGETTLGMVTGNNKFFALSPARAAELGMARSDLLRLSPPGSRHLRGLTFSAAAHTALGEEGAATWLFRPGGNPSPAALAYIAAGETANVHTAYKCRVRKPWWRRGARTAHRRPSPPARPCTGRASGGWSGSGCDPEAGRQSADIIADDVDIRPGAPTAGRAARPVRGTAGSSRRWWLACARSRSSTRTTPPPGWDRSPTAHTATGSNGSLV